MKDIRYTKASYQSSYSVFLLSKFHLGISHHQPDKLMVRLLCCSIKALRAFSRDFLVCLFYIYLTMRPNITQFNL